MRSSSEGCTCITDSVQDDSEVYSVIHLLEDAVSRWSPRAPRPLKTGSFLFTPLGGCHSSSRGIESMAQVSKEAEVKPPAMPTLETTMTSATTAPGLGGGGMTSTPDPDVLIRSRPPVQLSAAPALPVPGRTRDPWVRVDHQSLITLSLAGKPGHSTAAPPSRPGRT